MLFLKTVVFTFLPGKKEKNMKLSQAKAVLIHLQEGNLLTPLEALDLFGTMRLAAIIEDLRKDHEILTHIRERNGKRFAEYEYIHPKNNFNLDKPILVEKPQPGLFKENSYYGEVFLK